MLFCLRATETETTTSSVFRCPTQNTLGTRVPRPQSKRWSPRSLMNANAAINTSGDLLFLSDHAGEMEVWRLYSWDFSDGVVDNPPYRPYKRVAVAGGHPAWLDIGGTPGFFLSVGESDSSDIIFLDSPGAEEPVPFITSPGFDGHPAAGPVWWDSISVLP